MAQTSHHDSADFLPHDVPEQRRKVRSFSFGFGAVCLLLVAAIAVLAHKLNQQNAARVDLQARLNQATSEMTELRNDLTQANAKAAGLQAQFDNATRQVTNLQAEAQKSQEAGTGLQAELAKARTDLRDLRSEQERVQAQVTELQAQTEMANTASSGLQKELTAARGENESLKSQLAQAKDDVTKMQLAAVPAQVRPLPLTTEFKKSFFGRTFTLQIKNTGADPLTVNLGITGSDTTPSTSTTIEGGRTFKMEGIAPGAKVDLASDGFETVTLTAM